jgi:hypothetical protein
LTVTRVACGEFTAHIFASLAHNPQGVYPFFNVEETDAVHAPSNSSGLFDGLILALVVGALPTVMNYTFGIGDHIEQLPIVMRAIDPSFLRADFFTNASAAIGPRTYYAHFIALLARAAALHYVYFALALLVNTLVAWITYLFAKDVHDGSRLAGLFAVCGAMSLTGFRLGSAANIYEWSLVPAVLAMPLILGAVWAGLRRRPLLSAGLAGMASLLHPLLGLETAGILWITQLALLLMERRRHGLPETELRKLALALGVIVVFASFNIVPYAGMERISTERFIDIAARFRHPHHYLPSTFDVEDYLNTGAFLLSAGLAWWAWRRKVGPQSEIVRGALIVVMIVLLLCLGGYVFVELIPTRIWTMAQTFRLLVLVKWLGWVVMLGVIARLIDRPERRFEGYVLAISLATPHTMVFAHLAWFSWDWLRGPLRFLRTLLDPGPVLLLVALLLLRFPPPFDATAIYAVAILAAVIIHRWPKTHSYPLILAGVSAVLILTLGFGESALIRNVEGLLGRSIHPQIKLEALSGDAVDMARYAAEQTPDDSIFLTPPGMGEFRYLAQRAIVVDFGAFPFQDLAMLEWKSRINECYDYPDQTGWDALQEMKLKYRIIKDDEIRDLSSRYGIDHAVLDRRTGTEFPVLYENSNYKVIKLGE